MNKIELRMLYKTDAGDVVENQQICAHISKKDPEMVITEELLDYASMRSIQKKGFFEIPDTNYLQWLEEKLMELL